MGADSSDNEWEEEEAIRSASRATCHVCKQLGRLKPQCPQRQRLADTKWQQVGIKEDTAARETISPTTR